MGAGRPRSGPSPGTATTCSTSVCSGTRRGRPGPGSSGDERLTASGWDPAKYLEFAGHRLRPAVDLLARVPATSPAVVHDLGCGAGNVTRLLLERWPAAAVTGVDGSSAMLTAARAAAPEVTWVQADIGAWRSSRAADVVFSNAALHWLDDHPALFPRLIDGLAPGGVLAVQMPRNHGAPSHTEMVAAAGAGPWRNRLRTALRDRPVAGPGVYYDILASHVSRLDIWETEYLHVLEGDNPVVEWTRGSALKPLLDALEDPERSSFLDEYSARVSRAYPRRSDGRTLFPFRRLFIVAVR